MSFHVWEDVGVQLSGSAKKCKKCKLDDVHTTEECPEREVTDEERNRIKLNMLDYKQGKWRHYASILD